VSAVGPLPVKRQMNKKVITRIPLTELWDEAGLASFERKRFLRGDEIKQSIAAEDIHFVLADVSQPLKWIGKQEKFNFWKSELKEHLCENPIKGCHLEDFKDDYFYFASLWTSNIQKVILVEKYH
jgi:hypothetical protein